MFSKKGKDMFDMLQMLFQGIGENQNIIKVQSQGSTQIFRKLRFFPQVLPNYLRDGNSVPASLLNFPPKIAVFPASPEKKLRDFTKHFLVHFLYKAFYIVDPSFFRSSNSTLKSIQQGFVNSCVLIAVIQAIIAIFRVIFRLILRVFLRL